MEIGLAKEKGGTEESKPKRGRNKDSNNRYTVAAPITPTSHPNRPQPAPQPAHLFAEGSAFIALNTSDRNCGALEPARAPSDNMAA